MLPAERLSRQVIKPKLAQLTKALRRSRRSGSSCFATCSFEANSITRKFSSSSCFKQCLQALAVVVNQHANDEPKPAVQCESEIASCASHCSQAQYSHSCTHNQPGHKACESHSGGRWCCRVDSCFLCGTEGRTGGNEFTLTHTCTE